MNRKVWSKLVVLITFTLLFGLVYATPQYSQDTAQPCIICHPQTLKELGPAGEYYKEKGTLEGYGELPREVRKVLGGECTVCHAQLKPNPKPRSLEGGPTSPNHRFELKHGGGQFWCFACHDPTNRDKLRLVDGTTIDFEDSILLCSQCHAVVYDDWKKRIHGKWMGSWKEGKPAEICVDCHNPHDPVFGKLVPEPAPEKPPSSPTFENYNIYALLVLLASLALAIFSVWK